MGDNEESILDYEALGQHFDEKTLLPDLQQEDDSFNKLEPEIQKGIKNVCQENPEAFCKR